MRWYFMQKSVILCKYCGILGKYGSILGLYGGILGKYDGILGKKQRFLGQTQWFLGQYTTKYSAITMIHLLSLKNLLLIYIM